MIKKEKFSPLKMDKQLQNQKGMSAFTIAASVVIGALLIIGGVSLFNFVGNQKLNNFQSEISTLKGKTSAAFLNTSQINANDISVSNLAALGFWPASMVSTSGGNTVVADSFGGGVTVAAGNVNSNGDSIIFTYANVPKSICVGLGSGILDSSVEVMTANGSSIKASGGSSSLANAVNGCNQGDLNSVSFTITK